MFALHKYQAHEDCFSGYLPLLTELYFRFPGIILKYVTLRKCIFGFGLWIAVAKHGIYLLFNLNPIQQGSV